VADKETRKPASKPAPKQKERSEVGTDPKQSKGKGQRKN
jgi:hypothetical protein